MDANKVTTYEKGQTVDPITLHKENDSDGWPQWLDENQSSGCTLENPFPAISSGNSNFICKHIIITSAFPSGLDSIHTHRTLFSIGRTGGRMDDNTLLTHPFIWHLIGELLLRQEDHDCLSTGGQHLYAAVCGESASNSNIHRDQPSPRILMDAALHCVDESSCVKLGQTWAEDTACELCYGTGCKNGYRAASGMGYVISLQRVMDTTARVVSALDLLGSEAVGSCYSFALTPPPPTPNYIDLLSTTTQTHTYKTPGTRIMSIMHKLIWFLSVCSVKHEVNPQVKSTALGLIGSEMAEGDSPADRQPAVKGSCVHLFQLSHNLIILACTVNKHKPWIETSYHGVITENTDIVLLDPPLVALDKDAPIPYAGIVHFYQLLMAVNWRMIITTAHSDQMEAVNGDSDFRGSSLVFVMIEIDMPKECALYKDWEITNYAPSLSWMEEPSCVCAWQYKDVTDLIGLVASQQENKEIITLILFKAPGNTGWFTQKQHRILSGSNSSETRDDLVEKDPVIGQCVPGEICAFNIHGLEAPFEAVVLNGTSGEGQLRARGLVDCELQKEYTFIIQAHDCGSGPGGTEGKKSHKAVVHIQVNDVNEFAPVFREPQYRAAVTEGKIYDSILQVEATDQDCSPQYSQICNYQITTTSTPFAIDRNGNIRNTEKLSFDRQQQYEIQVTAWDCGQKRALHSVPVRIDVKPVCKPGWQVYSPVISGRDHADKHKFTTQRLGKNEGESRKNITAAENNSLHRQKRQFTADRTGSDSIMTAATNAGWNKRVDYEPGTGSKQLFPKMHLETCGGPLSSVRTTVELQTSHIGKGCDRETYSEKSLQKLCG
ncbi:Calsyntenin-2 Alcadein-gamma [Collichthys lucidus]|uniref:Calsyntenin-2 Alcadein-gamma n=1 Tax=Collichthys lucidus TaxID=240159 RepID=A0A4V6XYT6_COLLU|nr:Calsyntenin-2 Alcadein-gamma [Collichthys lucidus]